VPSVSGKYQIYVAIKNFTIPGSPFTMQCAPCMRLLSLPVYECDVKRQHMWIRHCARRPAMA